MIHNLLSYPAFNLADIDLFQKMWLMSDSDLKQMPT